MREIHVTLPREDFSEKEMAVKAYLKRYAGISTSSWKRIKHSGTFAVNGIPSIAARTTVVDGDIISYDITRTSKLPVEPMALDIRYEDPYILVINKPAGMLVHPTPKVFHGTLASGVLAHYEARGEHHDFHPMHRLDMDTSGLVAIAKEPEIQFLLTGKNGVKPLRREYLAIVEKAPAKRSGCIDAPIARELPSIIRRVVAPHGQEARTHYTTLLQDGHHALLQLRLDTGRTHQIRVHLAHLGIPLLGDTLYGGDNACIARQALHAAHLSFFHPILALPLSIYAPLPSDMGRLLSSFSPLS